MLKVPNSPLAYKPEFLKAKLQGRVAGCDQLVPVLHIDSGKAAGNVQGVLAISLLVLPTLASTCLSGGGPPGGGLNACKISQGYMSQECICSLEEELRVLYLVCFSLV